MVVGVIVGLVPRKPQYKDNYIHSREKTLTSHFIQTG